MRFLRRDLIGLTVAIGLVAMVVPVSSAGAAVTIGSDLAPDPVNASSCIAANCTTMNTTLPGQQVVSPLDGVVVRWRVRVGHTNAGGNNARLEVVRPAGATAFTGVNTSPTALIPETPFGNETTYTFSTQQPIRAGEQIALGVDAPDNSLRIVMGNQPGVTRLRWEPPLAAGETRNADFTFSNSGELLVNADVEADCDNDGLGDETQDTDIFGCELRGRTLVLDANKAKVLKGKKVRLSGQLDAADNQSACETGQSVELQRKRPSQPTFETFEVLTTAANGAFSTKTKIRKTFQYRAVVGQIVGCAGATSDTEKVKVKKK